MLSRGRQIPVQWGVASSHTAVSEARRLRLVRQLVAYLHVNVFWQSPEMTCRRMLPHARSQTFGNACPRSCFDWQCTSFTKGNRRISFKKESAKNYRFQKTQVPLPFVKDTGGMAKLSIACSIVFSDGCIVSRRHFYTLHSVNKTLLDAI